MSKENIRPKKKSRRSIMRQVRAQQVKNKRMSSSSSSLSSSLSSSSVNIDDVNDLLDINLIIHMQSLISLLKQTLCSECNHIWDGSPSIKARNGLYIHVEFICSNCGCITHLYSSPEVRDGKRKEINARLELGATLCGLGYNGIMKLLGVLNLPPPTQQRKYSETQEFILDYVENCQQKSMMAAIEEAIAETGGARELTVSGDGAWLTRGHTSVHGVSALCSTTKRPKVLDTIWSSKKCVKCQGAESLRHVNPALFKTFQENHKCQLNYTGKLL